MQTLKAAIVALCLLASGSSAVARRSSGWVIEEGFSLDHEWHNFKKTFGRKYPVAEEIVRKGIFALSLARAIEHNKVNVRAGGKPVFGVTKFSDLTLEEMNGRFKGRKGRGKYEQTNPATGKLFAIEDEDVSVRVPTVTDVDAVDWTSAGYTTPVKNQGQCGSCWAHSAVEQIESQWMLNGEAMWPFSVQMVNSCTQGAWGCGGGDTLIAYEQLMSNQTKTGTSVPGVASAAMVPYQQSMTTGCTRRKCTLSCDEDGVGDLSIMSSEEALTGPYAIVTGYSYATSPCTGDCDSQDLTTLNNNLASAPASICVNAATWGDYVGGVLMTEACGGYAYGDLDHCVQLTGFNLTASEPYYLVRNSWATNWGEDGYILLSASDNTCGLADEATFVEVSADI